MDRSLAHENLNKNAALVVQQKSVLILAGMFTLVVIAGSLGFYNNLSLYIQITNIGFLSTILFGIWAIMHFGKRAYWLAYIPVIFVMVQTTLAIYMFGDFGAIPWMFVFPTCSFLVYKYKVATAISLAMLLVLSHSLLISTVIPPQIIDDSIRIFFVSAYTLIFAISTMSSFLVARARRRAKRAEQRISELEKILSMCMYCKKIRVQEDWHPLEKYLLENQDTLVSHGMCPDCLDEQMQENGLDPVPVAKPN